MPDIQSLTYLLDRVFDSKELPVGNACPSNLLDKHVADVVVGRRHSTASSATLSEAVVDAPIPRPLAVKRTASPCRPPGRIARPAPFVERPHQSGKAAHGDPLKTLRPQVRTQNHPGPSQRAVNGPSRTHSGSSGRPTANTRDPSTPDRKPPRPHSHIPTASIGRTDVVRPRPPDRFSQKRSSEPASLPGSSTGGNKRARQTIASDATVIFNPRLRK